MSIETYLDGLKWYDIYINGCKSDYKISNNGSIIRDGKRHESNIFEINGKKFKYSHEYLYARLFIDNNNGDTSLRNLGRLEWWTNKTLVGKAIDIELKYWNDRSQMLAPEEQRVSYACELMSNPEIRLPFVSSITGISKKDLYEIRMGNKWNDIACNYEMPMIDRDVYDIKYQDSQIHEVCSMLTSEQTFRQMLIQRMTGVSPYTIDLVRSRKAYNHISVFYEFCYEVDHSHGTDNGIYTNQQVRQACYMLENPDYSYKFISEFCNINPNILYKIRDRKIFTNISKDFEIQLARNSIQLSPVNVRIVDLISNGYLTNEIISRIQLEFNIPGRKKVLNMINDMKNHYFNNVYGSTTISDDPN